MSRCIMMRLVLAAVLLLPGAAARALTPADAIRLTAKGGVFFGTYSFMVRSVGMAKGRLFLNSETDYRNPQNFSAALAPAAARTLEHILGGAPAAMLVGRTICVEGAARRVPIFWFSGSRMTGFAYYQHNVAVTRPGQISLACKGNRMRGAPLS